MQFTYQDKYTSTDIKSLLKQIFNDTGLVPDYNLVLCNGIKWDDPKSHFAKTLDVSIDNYKLQLDLILNEFKSQNKDSELTIAKLQKNTKPNILKQMLKRLLQDEPTKQITEILKEQKELKSERQNLKAKLV